MKKGAIDVQNGTPTITCNFHNSKFSLTDGSCKSWCTGVLGLPGKIIIVIHTCSSISFSSMNDFQSMHLNSIYL